MGKERKNQIQLKKYLINNKKISYILKKINVDSNTLLPFLNKSNNLKNIQLDKKTTELIKKHFEIDYKYIPQTTKVDWK